MQNPAALLPLLVIALVLAAGCTTPEPAPQTTVTTTATTPAATVTTPAMPADLARPWTLTLFGTQGGNRVQKPTARATLSFRADGTLSGYTGCNNFNAGYTLTGETLPRGQGIVVGPVESTLKYCEQIADDEATYLAILQDAAAYVVNGDKLTITAKDGNTLSFQTTASLPATTMGRLY